MTKATWESSQYKYSNCWKQIDRRNFIDTTVTDLDHWSQDRPLNIGSGETTSQPSLITNMVDLLELDHLTDPAHKLKILDIGAGTGVVSALMACITDYTSHIVGVEIHNDLVKKAKQNIRKSIPKHHSRIQIITRDVYDLFENPGKYKNYFDRIYVGAEPKTQKEIQAFKKGIRSLITESGIAVAPIKGEIMKFSNQKWHSVGMPVRFVALETSSPPHHKTRRQRSRPRAAIKQHGGRKKTKRRYLKRTCLSESKQNKLIKEEHETRTSLACERKSGLCDVIAVTARSAKLYKDQLFPDFKTMQTIEHFCKNKCIIDVGSGMNTLYKHSFISQMARKKIGKMTLGLDLEKLPLSSRDKPHYAKFKQGNIKTITRNQLGLPTTCQSIVLINNVLYLWIDDPKELLKIYKNMFSWLSPGSQIRIFPVYFKRYGMFDPGLRKYISSKAYVEFFDPKINAEDMYEWDTEKKKRVYLPKKKLNAEASIHDKLQAKTMVLTLK